MTLPNPSAPKVEPSLGKNFFVWGNIVLMALIPWLLIQSMAGLAVGDPIFPDWFEISLLGLPAIALVTWLQWIQPISPFSLWLIAKPSEKLTEQERCALTLISQPRNGWYVTGWIAIAVAIFMSAVFCKIYAASPLSQVIAPFPDRFRFLGVLWAEVFFLLSNFLLQSGVSALRVKFADDADLSSLAPFAPEKINDSFTHLGWRSPQFFTDDQVDSTLIPISPETLTEEVTNGGEEQELEISNLVENEAIDELLEQEELEISEVAEDVAESKVVQESIDDIAIAENPDITSETLAELAIENTAEEVLTEIKVNESLDVTDNLSELVTEEIESEKIESDLLVSEEIVLEEIESEQLSNIEQIQIEDSSQSDAIANLEISDPPPNEEIVEELETAQELELVEEVIEELIVSEYKQEINEEIVEVTEDVAIAEISPEINPEINPDVIDSTSLDFENELDELIAFNLYVENILQEYLEEESVEDSLEDVTTNNPADTNNDEVVDIIEITETSEIATAIAEEVLIAEEILEEGIPETITPPLTLIIPEVEDVTTNNPADTNNDGVVDIIEITETSQTATAIAEEVLIAEEILEEGIPEAVVDLSTLEISEQQTEQNLSIAEPEEEPKAPQQPKQSPKYLVEEFLVDKYLAKLEQLNKAEKSELGKNDSEETNITEIQPLEPKPVADEFADLDDIINGKTVSES
jgi:hypothetical protein